MNTLNFLSPEYKILLIEIAIFTIGYAVGYYVRRQDLHQLFKSYKKKYRLISRSDLFQSLARYMSADRAYDLAHRVYEEPEEIAAGIPEPKVKLTRQFFDKIDFNIADMEYQYVQTRRNREVLQRWCKHDFQKSADSTDKVCSICSAKESEINHDA